MNPAADKLKADIATAEARLKELEARTDVPPAQRTQMQYQIKRVQDMLRTLRIQLAGMTDRRNACPVCDETTPPGWLLCEVCAFEVPVKLQIAYDGARGHAHARKANRYPPAEIARCEENERLARLAIISHLRQHGSALAA